MLIRVVLFWFWLVIFGFDWVAEGKTAIAEFSASLSPTLLLRYRWVWARVRIMFLCRFWWLVLDLILILIFYLDIVDSRGTGRQGRMSG